MGLMATNNEQMGKFYTAAMHIGRLAQLAKEAELVDRAKNSGQKGGGEVLSIGGSRKLTDQELASLSDMMGRVNY